MIPAVNFHLWEPCNMRCQFCFATFQDVKKSILPKGHLPKEQAIEVVSKLAQAGFKKITFAGGEPTLCSWLPELIYTAKSAGLTTMIVTNGTNLSATFLEANKNHLDWITLSVDSLVDDTNLAAGRAINGKKVLNKEVYVELTGKIKQFGFGLKINTVVSSKNYSEIMTDFIQYAAPSRWKIFQVLPITGQNDLKVDALLTTAAEYQLFLKNNKAADGITQMVPEDNNQMKGSYVMVDPAGRFFDNSSGQHIYSDPINEIGCHNAYNQMNYSQTKFMNRGGLYDWEINKSKVA